MDKIVCFGKNYRDHAAELGDAIPQKPVIFLKPPSVLRQATQWDDCLSLQLPEGEKVHYECELVFQLKAGGYRFTPQQAEAAIGAYTVGLDMTLRDRQAQLKKNGHPWTIGKVFIDSAVIGPWIKVATAADYLNAPFAFALNGQLKQQATVADALFKPIDLLVYASHFFPFCAGDIIFTGTPKGVGSVQVGDQGNVQVKDHAYAVLWHKSA